MSTTLICKQSKDSHFPVVVLPHVLIFPILTNAQENLNKDKTSKPTQTPATMNVERLSKSNMKVLFHNAFKL